MRVEALMKSAWSIALLIGIVLSGVPIAAQEPATSDGVAGSSALHTAVAREAAHLAQSASVRHPVASGSRDPWILRHPVLVSAGIGTGIGLLKDAEVARCCGGKVPELRTFVGAGVGALAGLAVSSAIGSTLTYSSSGGREAESAKRIVSRMGQERRVEIAATGLALTKATITDVEAERFAVLPDSGVAPVSLAYTDIFRIRPVPMGSGAKVAIGAAVATVGMITLICLSKCGG
jgi:hypothetical protein